MLLDIRARSQHQWYSSYTFQIGSIALAEAEEQGGRERTKFKKTK